MGGCRLQKGRVGCQFWSVYAPSPNTARYGSIVSSEADAVVFTLEQIDRVKRLVKKYPDVFELVQTASEAVFCMQRGKIASVMGAEGGHQINNSMGVLRMLYDLGVRYMTLTHNGSTAWAEAALDRDGKVNDNPKIENGLSRFGEAVVKEMNSLGMIVDLSHVHEKTMKRALEISKAPCIFSHSGARGVCSHPRNVPDSCLELVRQTKSVICCTFVAQFVSGPFRLGPNGSATIGEVADHFVYLREKVGIDCIGYFLFFSVCLSFSLNIFFNFRVGGDFDGCKDLPIGLEDVSKYGNLAEELKTRGFSESDLIKVMGGNLLRAWNDVEIAARKHFGDDTIPSVERLVKGNNDDKTVAGGRKRRRVE